MHKGELMKRLLGIAATAALLAGCATAPSSGPFCPELVPYSHAAQRAAAAELDALPPSAMLRRMIDDYGDLRARIRAACQRR